VIAADAKKAGSASDAALLIPSQLQLSTLIFIQHQKRNKTVVDNYNTIILMLNGATTVDMEIYVKV